ncbi:galactoside O-acetyltransferase [Sphingobacterium faecium NBRC 15299]|jgi:acetyltransferase-like isoleucine patch superfamily enzyme|uniref:sugar O-acetyltransferase n=1 Tax=Sphingobacterium faecium TaxID=34087 RepID=UPI000D3C23BB|nr:sugar O-acetyltransferase [Sphingobacterium faecium]MQP30072.1 maltose O-acetyltransferase [Sphingobacterium faecium]PTX13939.1 maltose O-acetyltransferase [Sphingobacterium faecium]GEM64021.1 galactoside O-acetyltransferase [Sphingobacterium faecium NBRC 15299]
MDNKNLRNQFYRESGKELFEKRLHAKIQIKKFNDTEPKSFKERQLLIKNLLKTKSNRFFIEAPFYCDYGFNISIDDNFFANYNCTLLDSAPITIGKNVLFGPHVSLFTSTHAIHPEDRAKGWQCSKSITIADNVWLGGHVIVNPGVNIGENSIIGSGSVVTKDIPANVIAAGNPCKIIRNITEADRLEIKESTNF